RSGLLLLLLRSAATSRAREARVVEVAVGVVVVEAVQAVEVAVGVVAGVGASVATVVAAVGVVVAVVAAVGVVAAAVVAVRVELFRGEVLAMARGSSSSVGARPLRPSSFVSGLLSVGRLGLLRSGVDIFALDYDAILAAMYALTISAEGDCYLCVPPDPGIEAAALGANESALPGNALAEALHTFTLDSGASRCFFRDSTTITPLPAPVPVRLADPSGGPYLARSTSVLPCLAVSSGSLSSLHLPSFSTNLVSTAALQDAMVTTTTPGVRHVAIYTCTQMGRHLATFTRRPGSSLYTLSTEPPQVAASGEVSASLPPLPPSPPPPILPCVEGRKRTTPHSSSFPTTIAPLQTLHMDVWGPARISGQGREHYFLLVVDDYTRYTMVFPLCNKGEHLQSDRGGEFSSDLLRDFCHGEGILRSFMLSASSQQNGVAERHIGLVMEVARTSMIHATAPHFLWQFAVGDASVFRVWGSRAFVRDTSADKLSFRAIPCVFLGFPPDAHGWQLYHPTSCRVLSSQDVMFDESPSDSGAAGGGRARGDASGGAEPAGAEPGGAEPASAEPGGAEPEGAEPRGAKTEGAEPGGAESEGAESRGAEPRGTASAGGPAGALP
ncbi:unnamed protein product, partial [Closterium sp. NIES-54]